MDKRRLVETSPKKNLYYYNNMEADTFALRPPVLPSPETKSRTVHRSRSARLPNAAKKPADIHDKNGKVSITKTMRPIRIVPYWDYIEKTVTFKDLQFIKQLISSAINYLSRFVYVEPVVGPLFHARYCHRYEFIKSKWECVRYWDGYDSCGSVKIPSSHFQQTKVFHKDKSGNFTVTGGPGIANADFIIYVSGQDENELPGRQYCKGLVAGWAMACSFDQFGRPVAASIQLCSHLLKHHNWHEDTETTLHEIIHGIIMSGLWDTFYDKKNGRRYGPGEVLELVKGQHFDGFIKTPYVQNEVRKHLGCPTAKGAPVRNGHFDEWHMNTELMIPVNYQGKFSFSSILMALMADSGWYGVDVNYADPFRWGYKEGCSFWEKDCIDKKTHRSQASSYWCDEEEIRSCTMDHQAPASCQIFRQQNIPIQFQYFADIHQGGYKNTKFCPFRVPQSFHNYCMIQTGDLTSRCLTTKFLHHKHTEGQCFPMKCIPEARNPRVYNKILISIASKNKQVVCGRDNENQWVKTNVRHIPTVKCPLIDNICTTQNALQCKWGHFSAVYNKCICSVGWKGEKCNMPDKVIRPNWRVYSRSHRPGVDFSKPTYRCKHGSVASAVHPFIPGDKLCDNVCDCRMCEDEEWCRINIKPKTTSHPTKHPTPKPTHPPTHKPTSRPTLFPTILPTLVPTQHPSTKQPTNTPTTLKPTVQPTMSPTVTTTTTTTTTTERVTTSTPSKQPTNAPIKKTTTTMTTTTKGVTAFPSVGPTTTKAPTLEPTQQPSMHPSKSPTKKPTVVDYMNRRKFYHCIGRAGVIPIVYTCNGRCDCKYCDDEVTMCSKVKTTTTKKVEKIINENTKGGGV